MIYGYFGQEFWFPTPTVWDLKQADYPYKAATHKDLKLDPRVLEGGPYGEYIWRKEADGAGQWGFKTEAARNKFCKDYKGVAL